MKTTLSIAALIALTACSTQEQMVAMAQNECTALGYAPQSPEYIACTERGYRGTKADQDAAAAGVAEAAITYAILDAIF